MLEKTRNRGSIASIQKVNRDIEADKVKANKICSRGIRICC
jgi:hypothetical protein